MLILSKSLGSTHDGEKNECLMEHGYIMGATSFSRNSTKFSSCSINCFRNTLLKNGLVRINKVGNLSKVEVEFNSFS